VSGTRGRFVTILAAALVFASCDALPGAAQKPPSGPVGDVARAISDLLAPGTNVTDARFETFVADIDFPKAFGARAPEISDQIKQGRTSAIASKTSSASGSGRLASVRAVLGESLTIEFAKTLAASLDEFTKASGTHEFPRLEPTAHVSDGATSVTTSSTSQSETISSVGPQVKLSLTWSYRETTKDKTTGATLVDISEDRTIVGSINICPDPSGAVGAFIDVKDQFRALANSATTTLNATTGTVFTGYVDDSAALQNIHETLQDQQRWETAAGNGSYEATLSATSQADASGNTAGSPDTGSFTGAFSASDAAAAVRGAKAAAWSFVLDHHSLAEAYQSAQKLWRNGRCVVVTAPDYSAETPLGVSDQDKPQNDKAVDPSSETKFGVGLKGRFGGLVAASTNANLTGGTKTVAPNRVEGGSGSVTYKAPDEDDKKATVQLKSISKRGIGTLVLEFHTGKDALTLTITGTLSGRTEAFGGGSTTADSVTVGPLAFARTFGDVWQATGTWRSTIHTVATVAGSSQTCDGSEQGDITWQASTEMRAGKKVWVLDPQDADIGDGAGTLNCFSPPVTIRGVTIGGNVAYDSDGTSGGVFVSTLQTFVVPEEGGRIAVQGSVNAGGRGTLSASGTANAQTGK